MSSKTSKHFSEKFQVTLESSSRSLTLSMQTSIQYQHPHIVILILHCAKINMKFLPILSLSPGNAAPAQSLPSLLCYFSYYLDSNI